MIVSMCFSVLPGIAPAGEALLLWQKDPKPVTPRLAPLERADVRLRRADQLAPLKQGPPTDKSVLPFGQTAGVGLGGTNMCSATYVWAGNHIFCMIRAVMRSIMKQSSKHLFFGDISQKCGRENQCRLQYFITSGIIRKN